MEYWDLNQRCERGLRAQLMGYGFTYCGYKRKTSNYRLQNLSRNTFPAGRATSARRRYFIRRGDPFSIRVFSLSFYCDTKTPYKNYIQLRKFFNF